METFYIILGIVLYLCTCIFFHVIVCVLTKTYDDDIFSVKNLLLTILWPLTMWFFKD